MATPCSLWLVLASCSSLVVELGAPVGSTVVLQGNFDDFIMACDSGRLGPLASAAVARPCTWSSCSTWF